MTTSTDAGEDRPGQRPWGWEHPIEPRWMLLGDIGFDDSYDTDIPLAMCAAIEGLFVDLPARPRERFTLIGCTPDGVLADVLGRLPGSDRAWIGNVAIVEPPQPPGERPHWWGEDLGDVAVLAYRPSVTEPGTVDIDLDGFVQVHDRTDAVVRPGRMPVFHLVGPADAPYGTCRDVTGVFREQAPPPVPQVRLLGCWPEAALLTALGSVGQATKAAARRRRIRAEVYAVATDGTVGHVVGAVVAGTIASAEPSRLDPGLLDVTVDSVPLEPLPTGVLHILEHRRTGTPAEKNLWAGYDRALRHQWAGVALGHLSRSEDRPAETVYELDGRYVTDIEGFYCALGEAINGPGGYFGWNLDAVRDCLSGDFGARTPFRLVWHDSAVAREHLVAGYDRRWMIPAVTMDELLDLLAERHVEADLR